MTRQNLCPNPACGSNVTGWTGGAAPTQATGLSGFPVTTGSHYVSGTFQQTPAGAVTPGVTYTASVYVRTNSLGASGKTLYLGFTRSAGGDVFPFTAPFSTVADTVTRIDVSGEAPALATTAYLVIDGINAAVSSVDATAVLIEAAAATDTYFDGDSALASWDGTPDNSTSTLADATPDLGLELWVTSAIKALTADGDVTVVDSYLRNVVLTGGSDAATVVIKAGGSSGTTVLTLEAAAGESAATGELGMAYCPDGIYADLTGTGPTVTVVYE